MTTPNHQAELLPCPFCGSDFKVQQEPYDNGPMRGLWFLFHEYGPLGSPARRCRVEVPVHFGTKAEAIAFWNTRPASHEAELVEGSISTIWEQARINHATYSATGNAEDDLRFLTLGLVGEAGELANFIKKRWRDGDLHEDDCRKETADVLAYLMMVAQSLGMTPGDLIRTVAEKQAVFIAKMEARATKAKAGAA